MSAENQVSWSQLLLTSVLSIITSVTAGVLINEYLRWRREQTQKEKEAEKKAAEAKAATKPVLREEKEYWLIEHHVETQSFGTAPMMGGIVELGVRDGRVWLRKLWLPKEKYSREMIDKILASMQKCSLCASGLPLEKNLINPVKEENSRGNMPVARDVGFTVGGAVFGKVLNDAMDYFLTGKLGATNTQFAKILAGAGLILLPFGVAMGRDAENVFISAGSYLVTNVIDVLKQYAPSAPATRVTLRPIGGSASRRAPVPASYNAAALTE